MTLIVCGMDLDMYGFVGIIMLIGIVEKNAIMMIDFAIVVEHEEHLTPAQAIAKAASVRFRPIMMTTMAALMGALPIAVGWGAGAATRRPLGVAVVGGLGLLAARHAVRDAGVLHVPRSGAALGRAAACARTPHGTRRRRPLCRTSG